MDKKFLLMFAFFTIFSLDGTNAKKPQKIDTEHDVLKIKKRIQKEFKNSLDEDSIRELAAELTALEPKKQERIITKLKTIPQEKIQITFDLAFTTILTASQDPQFLSKEDMLITLTSLSNALASVDEKQFENVKDIAHVVFCDNDYNDVRYRFTLEDCLSLFHSFLNSQKGHLEDTKNRDDLLYTYHMIYDNLKALEVEPEEVQDPVYLASFAESFRTLDDEDLKDLCKTISDIYNNPPYETLKGTDICENWEMLATQLRSLSKEKREILSDFLSWLPSTFHFGPADAIEVFKEEEWIETIYKLETFEKVEPLAKKAFKIHDDQDMQLKALHLILVGLIGDKPSKDILQDIKDLTH